MPFGIRCGRFQPTPVKATFVFYHIIADGARRKYKNQCYKAFAVGEAVVFECCNRHLCVIQLDCDFTYYCAAAFAADLV